MLLLTGELKKEDMGRCWVTAACLNFLLGGVMGVACGFAPLLTLLSAGILDAYKADGRLWMSDEGR